MPRMERPNTAEELNALPEGPAFGMTEKMIDGQWRRVPVAPDMVAIYHGETDIISWQDADGECWQIGRYADGRWFKQRQFPLTATAALESPCAHDSG